MEDQVPPNTPAPTPEPASVEPAASASGSSVGGPASSGFSLSAIGAWLKQHWLPVTIVGVLVLGAGGLVVARQLLNKPKPAVPVVVKPAPPPPPPPPPATKPSPLTGAELDPATADRPITAVVIENQTDARPQSGLGQAGVVYEALAEGGITRFLAFFLDSRPKQMGPVRSVRTYFVSWGLEFDAPVAHAGGNADALDLVGPLGMKDMNEFAYGSSFFRANDRYAPHNLYTTSDLLDQLEAKLGFNKPATFKPSPRQKDAPSSAPNASVVDINYSYNGYQVQYRYDGGCDCYARFLAGAPHVDRNDNAQIKVRNVVVEYMPTAYGTTRIGEQTVRMGDSGMPVGSNKAIVFRDGTAVVGTWSKPSNKERTKLLDANGAEIPLNIGNTWYSIVPTDHPVSYH
jgi:hypothetical protein